MSDDSKAALGAFAFIAFVILVIVLAHSCGPATTGRPEDHGVDQFGR